MASYKRFWSIEDKGEDAKAGWFAVFANPFGDDEQGIAWAYVHPLVGWALITRGDSEEIVGLVAGSSVEPADKPTDGSIFVSYFQRGAWSQEQINALVDGCEEIGKRARIRYEQQRQNQSSGGDATEVGERRVLEAGSRQVSEHALQRFQDEEQEGWQGERTDAPQT